MNSTLGIVATIIGSVAIIWGVTPKKWHIKGKQESAIRVIISILGLIFFVGGIILVDIATHSILVQTPTPTSSVHSELYTKESIANHAKVLVWKYLGEPRYDELTVTGIETLVEGDMWEVVGKFAYVGQEPREFDAIIEIRPNGDSSLWGFSWK